MRNSNRLILVIIALAGLLSFIFGPINNSFAQANQTTTTTAGNQSSHSPTSSNTLKTSRINGSSIYTANEHALIVKSPRSFDNTNTNNIS